MPYYKDKDNFLHFLESPEFTNLLPDEAVEITDEEAEQLLPPEAIKLAPLSAWQVRKVLTQFGLRVTVEAAISQADQTTKDAWQFANEFARDDAILNAMANAIGITPEQLDQMFEVGITL